MAPHPDGGPLHPLTNPPHDPRDVAGVIQTAVRGTLELHPQVAERFAEAQPLGQS
jgi:hypothetical protein